MKKENIPDLIGELEAARDILLDFVKHLAHKAATTKSLELDAVIDRAGQTLHAYRRAIEHYELDSTQKFLWWPPAESDIGKLVWWRNKPNESWSIGFADSVPNGWFVRSHNDGNEEWVFGIHIPRMIVLASHGNTPPPADFVPGVTRQ